MHNQDLTVGRESTDVDSMGLGQGELSVPGVVVPTTPSLLTPGQLDDLAVLTIMKL